MRRDVPLYIMDINNLILNNLNYSLILFDEHLVLKFLNLPAREFTEYSDKFLDGADLTRFFYNNKYIVEKAHEVIRTGEGFIDFEYRFVNKKKNKRVVILEISKIASEAGFYIIISLKDITRFKEMDDNIKNEEKLKELSRFIAEMSHEIRNPLSGIKASASYLQKKFNEIALDFPVKFRELNSFLEIIIKEISRINNLIEDLLSLSKKHKTKTEKININKAVNEVILIENESLDDKDIEVIKEFDPSLPKVYASESALKQIFLNMLKNSIEAIKPQAKGSIKIVTKLDYTRHSPKFLKIEFIDNGCGISKKDIRNLFVPFFTTKEKGSGLGLAISQKIIYEHSGFITIDSIKNRGTTVTVYLPIEKRKS